MELKPFGSIKKCPKCKHQKANVSIEWYRAFATKYVDQGDNFQDYIERTCYECGYIWQEQCADAKEINDG